MDKDLKKATELVQADMKSRAEQFAKKLTELQVEFNCELIQTEEGIKVNPKMHDL